MATFYLDYEGGNDANDGTTFANRWKTITSGATAARIAPGDTVRIMKSIDPTSLGINGTWTNKSATLTLASALNLLVTDCEAAWTASANVTSTADAAVFRTGTKAAKHVIAAGFTTGLASYVATGTLDLSAYQGLTFWVQANAAVAASTLSLRLCSDVAGVTTVNTIAIPAIPQANQWVPVYVDLAGALGASIQSIALYCDLDPGTVTVYLDNISTVKAAGNDALNLQSLVGKNAAGETWWAIRSISGTTVLLDSNPAISVGSLGSIRGYSGTTETVTTYKRETIKLPLVAAAASNHTVQDSGTAGNLITFSGGWDRTAMTTQDGETWWDQQSGVGYVIIATTRAYLAFTKMNCVRGAQGLLLNSNSNNMTVTDGHFNNNNGSGLLLVGSSAIIGTIFCCGNGAYGFGDNVSSTMTLLVATSITANSNLTQGVCLNGSRPIITTMVCNNNGSDGYMPSTLNDCVEPYFASITAKDNGRHGVYMGNSYRWRGGKIGSLVAQNNTQYGFYLMSSRELTTIGSLTTSGNGSGAVGIDFSTGGGSVIVLASSLAEATKLSEVFTGGQSGQLGELRLNNFNGTAGDHRSYIDGSKAKVVSVSDSDRHTLSGIAWKVSPIGTTYVNADFPIRLPLKTFAVNASALVTVRAWVKRDNTGLTARLVCPGGQIAGVPSDVADTIIAGAGTYEELEITFTPSAAGVVAVELQCYGGSTYSAWVDDLTVLQA